MRLNKIFLMIIVILAMFLPLQANAADFRFKEQSFSISSGETVNDDLYIGSGDVISEGIIKGDLVVFGGQVRVNGKVEESLFVAGGQVVIEGEIAKNIRVAGGNVIIRGKVGHDILVAGGTVVIDRSAEIKNDVKAAAGQLEIAGSTGGVQSSVGSLTIRNTAKINGDVIYSSENDATVENGSSISGKITKHALPAAKKGAAGFFVFGQIMSLLMTILVALLFLFFLSNKAEKISTSWREHFGANLLWGFLFLIAVPVAVILLMITFIGLPLAVGAVFIYIILLYLGKIAGIISFSVWLQNIGKKNDLRQNKPMWIFVIVGAIVYSLLKLIPLIGWLAALLIFLAGLGALIRFDWELIKRLKVSRDI